MIKFSTRAKRGAGGVSRARRGIALFIAMFFVAGVGALALSAIYLTANATLLGKTYEKEDDLKYTSEAALAIGKAELNFNPAALPATGFDTLILNRTITSADAQPVPGLTVNVYVGPTGVAGGQFGRFASVVAEARDATNHTGFVRRLELTQESFAKFAYWSNNEGGGAIQFGGGDQLWGPVWSNDVISINSTGATFHDSVGTAMTVVNPGFGVFERNYSIHQHPITLPSLSTLSTLSALATVGGMNFTAASNGDETTVLTRIEFLATEMDDIPGDDSTGVNEGFFRVYTANSTPVAHTAWLRADWPGPSAALNQYINCGDWHRDSTSVLKFFPASVHSQLWLDTVTSLDTAITHHHVGRHAQIVAAHTLDSAEVASGISGIMQKQGARCYLGGDPHLVSVERTVANGYALSKIRIGGTDTTFTPIDSLGAWKQYSATPPVTMTSHRPNDARYLFPLYRAFNSNTKGVIYVAGTVGVSGVLRGAVTLFTPNTIVVLDDLRYATDPAARQPPVLCPDVLGLISGANTVIADNSLNTPQIIQNPAHYSSLDDTPDLYLHAVIMALGTSFKVQNYTTGPTAAGPCQGTAWGRGCLYLTGGVIQNTRGAVALSDGHGFIKRYSYDRCAATNPPPYFPTTGRFSDNRYYELDPVRFNVAQLFRSLTGG